VGAKFDFRAGEILARKGSANTGCRAFPRKENARLREHGAIG
jgi:hypothetical protein